MTAITRWGIREQAGAGRLPTSLVAPSLPVLLPCQPSVAGSWSRTPCSRSSPFPEKPRQLYWRCRLKCWITCDIKHLYWKSLLYSVFHKMCTQEVLIFLNKANRYFWKNQVRLFFIYETEAVYFRVIMENKRAVLVYIENSTQLGSLWGESGWSLWNRREGVTRGKGIKSLTLARLQSSILQRYPELKRR